MAVIGAGARSNCRQLPITGFAHKARIIGDACRAAVVASLRVAAERLGPALHDRAHHAPLDATEMTGTVSTWTSLASGTIPILNHDSPSKKRDTGSAFSWFESYQIGWNTHSYEGRENLLVTFIPAARRWVQLVRACHRLRRAARLHNQSLSSVLSSPPHPHRGWLLPCERYSSSCNMNLSGRGVWLTDVGVGSNEPCHTLLVIAIALSIGALLLGLVADSRRPHGKNIETLLAIIASVFIAAELALVVNPPFLSLPSWIIVAVWPDQQSRSATRSSEITFRSE
ncbi:hypothetical protein ACVWZ3_000445 [Bradyrhizobium sp. i1.3.6]